jgi:hypothetical protein
VACHDAATFLLTRRKHSEVPRVELERGMEWEKGVVLVVVVFIVHGRLEEGSNS